MESSSTYLQFIQDIHLQINGKTSEKSHNSYEFIRLLFSAWSWAVCQTRHLKYFIVNLLVLFYFEGKTSTPNAALNYITKGMSFPGMSLPGGMSFHVQYPCRS